MGSGSESELCIIVFLNNLHLELFYFPLKEDSNDTQFIKIASPIFELRANMFKQSSKIFYAQESNFSGQL